MPDGPHPPAQTGPFPGVRWGTFCRRTGGPPPPSSQESTYGIPTATVLATIFLPPFYRLCHSNYCRAAARLPLLSSLLYQPCLHAGMEGSSDEEDMDLGPILSVSASLTQRRCTALGAWLRGNRASRSGSQTERRANIERNFDLGHSGIVRDFFGWAGGRPLYDGERLARVLG